VILLDTNHLTVLRFQGSPRGASLAARLAASADQPVGTTVVNVEEAMRGWLAALEQGLAREDRSVIFGVLHDAVPDFGSEAA